MAVTDSTPLADRVATLEDRDAIRELIHELNWRSDENDLNGLMALFTDDVLFDVGSFGSFRGKAATRAFYEQTVATFEMRIHHATNQIIELGGDKARSRCYWQANLILQGRALVSSGHYFDELVKQNRRWLVAARKATITYLCPLDEGWAKTRLISLG